MSRPDSAAHPGGTWRTPALVHHNAWFPGRLVGGAALVLAPPVWSAGLLLRHLAPESAGFTPAQVEEFGRRPFAAPAQLAAYAESPAVVTAGYACFLLGVILLCPAVVTLARIVAARSPRSAMVGGTLMVGGLLARVYWAGVDQTAFRLAGRLGLEPVTAAVMDTYVDISYGPWAIVAAAALGLYAGTLVLAVGAFRSGTFGTGRLLLFLWPGTLWTGVLKESSFPDAVAAGALCLVLVPLGVRVLRDAVPELRAEPLPDPGRRPLRPLSW
ncbi:hypothetical protein ACIBCT_33175 [Streptosporangium sp. NPDC050855]|uniref:hypothetical protein n=1 Tax=Streptosporangium sp. NPDC050855 TaxID=3366194 RepID=UPI0037A72E19